MFKAGFPVFAMPQDEPRGKNIAKSFLFTAKKPIKYNNNSGLAVKL